MTFKKFYQLFTEGASSILFHHTYIRNLAQILDSGKFQLTFSLSGRPDRGRVQEDAFYMSFSRIRWSGYNHGSGVGSAIIEVDGAQLNSNYKVKPVDYWQYKFGTSHTNPGADEQEDRLVYKKSSIPAIRYIRNISILIDKMDRNSEYVVFKCKELGIPCYVYNDRRAFKLGDRRKVMAVGDLEGVELDRGVEYAPRMRDFIGIKKMIENPYGEDEEIDYVYKRMGYMDWKEGFSADFHNIKTSLDSVLRKFLEWVAYIERKSRKSIFDLMWEAAEKRRARDNVLQEIRSLSGLIQFIREGAAPGWASLKRESVHYYIRVTRKFKDVDDILLRAIELAKDTEDTDDRGWNTIADLLEEAKGLLSTKLLGHDK